MVNERLLEEWPLGHDDLDTTEASHDESDKGYDGRLKSVEGVGRGGA